jgi:RHS repeat-associated protein
MLTAAKKEILSAPMAWADECVLPLAAFGVYPKTRVWGSREKMLPCFSATAQLRIELRRGCEKSSGKTAAGSALDSNGNTLSKNDSTGTTNYTWDFENRLTSVTLPGTGGTVSFKYDPFGRRIYKSSSSGTSIYAYDGNNLIEETNSGGAVVVRYAHGLHIDEPMAMLRNNTTSYYNADALGSITSLSSAAGSLAQTYTYDSFGNTTNSSGSLTNVLRYTAREFDAETNLYFYRDRYFDQANGKFLTEDPTGPRSGDNLYAYVVNNPVAWNDPFGWQPSNNDCKTKPCSISVSCNPTPNTHGLSHCTVTTQEGSVYTAYDGFASGSVWWSRLKVGHSTGVPPGPNAISTETIDCDKVGQVAKAANMINDNKYIYSFPLQNSNTAAKMLTDAAGVFPNYPWGAYGAYP